MSSNRNSSEQYSKHHSMIFVVAALAFGSYGCKKDKPATEEISQETTVGGESLGVHPLPDQEEWDGGETSTPALETVTDEVLAEPAASPWGATRAEQCKWPERRPMSSSAESAFRDGVRSAAAGKASEAKRDFERAVGKDSRAYPAHYNLGVLADRAGDESKAIAFYSQALAAQPDYAAALRGIATIELRRGNKSAALSTVAQVAKAYPTNLNVQALHAEVLARAGRYDQAWDAARKALQCDERFVPALVALVKANMAQGRHELADSILAQGLAIDNNNAELHFLRGERLKDEPGRLRDTMKEYERAIRLRPDFADARMALGIQQLAGGNYQGALSHFQAAEKLIPTLPAVHVNLGDAYRSTKQWVESKRAYDEAIRLKERLPQAHFGLGLMYKSAAADYPGLDEPGSLQKATDEFKTYRSQMGARLSRNDPSARYLEDLARQIKRVQHRIDRDRERQAREAESEDGQ